VDQPRTIYETPRPAARPDEEIVTSTCAHNCGGRCVVNAHVRDGRIVKISTDPHRWTPDRPPLHACVRGFGAGDRAADRSSPCGATTYNTNFVEIEPAR
jgi:anaerobic dimethyl sulfoxide reductase subunit A